MSFDLFAHERGASVAPAGCGKTHSIADALGRYEGPPVLVLTHTNAGVGALRSRLRGKVPGARFRLATLDGWCLRIVRAFPRLSGMTLDPLARIDYPGIQRAALSAVRSGGLDRPLAATYARLVVDEYQDCSNNQHALAVALAERMPTNVLGDPMQRIFDFRPGDLPDWNAKVLADFPLVATFDKPWRWVNAKETDFGMWILRVRADLLAGRPVDLGAAPVNVRWVKQPADPAARHAKAVRAVQGVKLDDGEALIVIGDSRSRESRSEFARLSAGLTVVEPVDLGDMISAADGIAAHTGYTRLDQVLRFAKSVMTGVNIPELATRLKVLQTGTARTAATPVEAVCLGFATEDGYAASAYTLEALAIDGRRVFRRQLHGAMIEALRRAAARPGETLPESAAAIREHYRAAGRPLPGRGMASTLLVKGLEAEHAVILDAGVMNPRHLYVAMSRASKSLTIISGSRMLAPR